MAPHLWGVDLEIEAQMNLKKYHGLMLYVLTTIKGLKAGMTTTSNRYVMLLVAGFVCFGSSELSAESELGSARRVDATRGITSTPSDYLGVDPSVARKALSLRNQIDALQNQLLYWRALRQQLEGSSATYNASLAELDNYKKKVRAAYGQKNLDELSRAFDDLRRYAFPWPNKRNIMRYDAPLQIQVELSDLLTTEQEVEKNLTDLYYKNESARAVDDLMTTIRPQPLPAGKIQNIWASPPIEQKALEALLSKVTESSLKTDYWEPAAKIIREATEKASQRIASLEKQLTSSQKDLEGVETDLTAQAQSIDKLAIKLGLPLFCGTVVLLFAIPFVARRLTSGAGPVDAIFSSGVIIEINTVLLLTMTILILGLAGKMQNEVLGTLLGGIAGYVLNRVGDRTRYQRTGDEKTSNVTHEKIISP